MIYRELLKQLGDILDLLPVQVSKLDRYLDPKYGDMRQIYDQNTIENVLDTMVEIIETVRRRRDPRLGLSAAALRFLISNVGAMECIDTIRRECGDDIVSAIEEFQEKETMREFEEPQD